MSGGARADRGGEDGWAILVALGDRLRPLVGAPAVRHDWDARLVGPASRHLVSPALGWCVTAASGPHGPVEEYFAAALDLNRDRNRLFQAALDAALDVLMAAGIEAMLLKGSALLARGTYPDVGARFLADLDLLVRPHEAARAWAALRAAGFSQPDGPAMPTDHHHLPMLAHPATGVGLELHHEPLSWRQRGLLGAGETWEQAASVDRGGRRVPVPSPTAMIAQLVAGAQLTDRAHHRRSAAFRTLLDLALLARDGAVDWDWLSARFARHGRAGVLAMTAAAADRLLGAGTPYAGRAPRAEAWLRAGLAQGRVRHWLIDMGHRFGDAYHVVRHDPARFLRALAPARRADRARKLGSS